MTKTEIKKATTQELIEQLINNEGIMVARNGYGVKGKQKESIEIAKELSKRKIIDFDSFIKNAELET